MTGVPFIDDRSRQTRTNGGPGGRRLPNDGGQARGAFLHTAEVFLMDDIGPAVSPHRFLIRVFRSPRLRGEYWPVGAPPLMSLSLGCSQPTPSRQQQPMRMDCAQRGAQQSDPKSRGGRRPPPSYRTPSATSHCRATVIRLSSQREPLLRRWHSCTGGVPILLTQPSRRWTHSIISPRYQLDVHVTTSSHSCSLRRDISYPCGRTR